MPQVGKKHFPYTPDGQAQAAAERAARDNTLQGGISAAMRRRKAPGKPPKGRGFVSPETVKKKKSTTWESDR